MSNHYLKHLSLSCILALSLTLSVGCDKVENIAVNKENEQANFDTFLNEIFVDEVQNDSITLNYTLANPSNYGITNFKPTFGEYSVKSMRENLVTSENDAKRLSDFHYDALTEEQQLTYDILKDYVAVDEMDEKLLLYGEALGPTTGLQAQLPVLLAEYNFYTKADIEHYLQLLPCINDYFNQIIAFEQEKSKAGLFMSDKTAENILGQCRDFVKKPKENYLIEVFNDRIDAYEGLTEEERTSFKKTNKEAILKHVIPAYEALIKGLEALKGTGKNEGGLCNFTDGKAYYKKLVKAMTGSDRSIEDIDKLLEQTAKTSTTSMQKLYLNDETILDQYVDLSYPMTDPKEILDYLEKNTKNDFPDLKSVNCNIKYVHESLEDHLSPAFYLTPAIDNFQENNIYINRGGNNDLDSIFTTIAHEGYPGHLYQSVYYNQQNPNPIRSIVNFGGYSEGWATYVEMYSYGLAGIDTNLAEFAKQNMIITLCMYGQIDIGVNYYGWDLEKTGAYLKKMGIEDDDVTSDIYSAMIDEPANYLQYTLGYIEFMELRDKAEKALSDKFNLKEFHKFLLDIGPCQFSIIDNHLDQWIKNQK